MATLAFAYVQESELSTETGRIYATMHERYYQLSHGHPGFSPDDRWVIFSSDMEKCNNGYIADVVSL